MTKFWRILWYEYTRHVLRKRFLFALISMPLLIAVMLAVSILGQFLSSDSRPIGYVAPSGFLDHPKPLPRPPSTRFFRSAGRYLSQARWRCLASVASACSALTGARDTGV